jgi:iron complex transport system substrate-binding protein
MKEEGRAPAARARRGAAERAQAGAPAARRLRGGVGAGVGPREHQEKKSARCPSEASSEKGGMAAAVCSIVVLLLLALSLAAQQPARPSRIISLIPAVTEMLFAIGAGPQVVAVSSFDSYPAAVETLPRVGALLDPDLEKILALRPDLVVTYGTQVDLQQQLGRAKVPIFDYSHAGLADVTQTMRQLGARVGRSQEAEKAALDVEAALAEIKRRTNGRTRPRVLLVFGRESGALRGIYASGGIGFLHDMLEAAGGTNVFADVERQSVQATTELILARKPEVILELSGARAGEQESRAQRAAWNALGSVPAVRSNRVYLIADERTLVPGPRVAEGTRLLAAALHPDVFR